MKKLFYHWILIVIFLMSCNIKNDKEVGIADSAESTQTETENKIDYFEKANEFASYLLGDKLRLHQFDTIQEVPKHIEIFSKNGLERIIAFSNKNYPKNVEPNYYEHFTLFCLEYSDEIKAERAFDTLCGLSRIELDNLVSYDKETIEKAKFLEFQSKPGGLIIRKGNFIFSLVETCRDTPIGGTWTDYENLFISFIKESPNDTITALNADCGKMKYREESK